jgi:hypothetical protein
LHASTKAENQVKSRFLLNVVVGERTAVLELFASKDKTLLVRWNAFFVLNLALDVVDSVAGLDLKSDGLTGDCRGEIHQSEVRWRSPQAEGGVNLRVLTKICIFADRVDDVDAM